MSQFKLLANLLLILLRDWQPEIKHTTCKEPRMLWLWYLKAEIYLQVQH